MNEKYLACISRGGLLTIDQISTLISVEKSTIYYWVHRNEIPYIKVGRHLRFDGNEVIDFFKGETANKKKSCYTPFFSSNKKLLKSGSLKTEKIVRRSRSRKE